MFFLLFPGHLYLPIHIQFHVIFYSLSLSPSVSQKKQNQFFWHIAQASVKSATIWLLAGYSESSISGSLS